MNVLGISAYYHDAAAALVTDQGLVAAAAEERFTRQRHDSNYPALAIRFCLEQAGLRSHDLDAVVFYEEPETKFTRVLASTLSGFPRSRGAFVGAMRKWLTSRLWIRNEISRRLDLHPRLIHSVPHHLSHAAHAFLTSGFDNAAILCVDAVGEWSTTSIHHGRWGPGGPEIREVLQLRYPHSLGLAYSTFTAFLGFLPNDGEANVMALAAFGKPRFADPIRQIIRPQRDGTYCLDPDYFDFTNLSSRPYTSRFIRAFGEPRSRRVPLPFDALNGSEARECSPDAVHYADVAASVQLVLEECMLNLAARASRETNSPNLCLGGGVALNCVANSRIMREGLFARVHIPADPGDAGGAVGAALHIHAGGRGGSTPPAGYSAGVYLGRAYREDTDIEMFKAADSDEWSHFRLPGSLPDSGNGFDVRQYDGCDDLVPEVVEDLAAGKAVGWFQGRFEFGPRALGNRSILLSPGNVKRARELSRTIKGRASFRPYALSMTESAAQNMLDGSFDPAGPAGLMQTVAPVRPDQLQEVRAGTHTDGTTRPQVVTAGQNREFHRLLEAFGAHSGTEALVNTSFNEAGYPIVSTPAEALITFIRGDLETLVINNTVLRRKP